MGVGEGGVYEGSEISMALARRPCETSVALSACLTGRILMSETRIRPELIHNFSTSAFLALLF